ncbi:MAG: MFS transporter [Candidatus Andeanibacterium colombiense]|uniref:MFS transporter n=1 Tax=Candidatus Andeanibacterium colombiense TaxID=3121345 RepID=A0AAJ5X496_9SPHN|nr:MAG: MFS transporter [Sphingomonadaceae bacterium]
MTLATRRDSPWLALTLLTGVATVGFIDRIVVNVLVEPLKREFQLSDFQVSLMAAAFAVLNVLVGIGIARVAERKPRVGMIALGTLIWSLATALCGMAANFVQLLMARVGVGLGEAIGIPGNQSVAADYFPPQRRGLAMSILLLAPPLGAFIGFVGGGWIAQNFDWRWTFLIAAIPGLVLGVLVYLFIAEPPRGRHDADASDDVPGVGAVLGRLFLLPSARHLVIGSTIAAGIGFGLNTFFISLMIRRFGLSIGEASLYAGLIASLPAAISVVGMGWLGDRFGADNPAAYAIIPGAAMLLGGPLYIFAITRADLAPLLGMVTIAAVLQFGYLGITYASLQNLMHPRMRATASATLNAIYAVAGALGPMILGRLSDWLEPFYAPGEGLALAMAAVSLAYLWAGAHYLLAARHIGPDLEKTRAGGI